MKNRFIIGSVIAGAIALVAVQIASADDKEVPKPESVAPHTWLIPGGTFPERQPDGNTVVFAAPKGLVVMDTGRHPWHTDAIRLFAEERHLPIVAIVNSHWHLDHVSGNPALKAAYPQAKVYASGAIFDALTGFLARSAADGRKYLNSPDLPPATLDDLKRDLATVDNGKALVPDVVISKSGTHVLGGRSLRVNLAKNAATDGDVWVYDPATKVAAVGDLVTLPAPFLDTACPAGWSKALQDVWATPFKTVIPGHGHPMDRAQFATYRTAFDAFIACSASSRDKAECAGEWADNVKSLLGADESALRQAKGMAGYYVSEVLRANGGKSADCHM